MTLSGCAPRRNTPADRRGWRSRGCLAGGLAVGLLLMGCLLTRESLASETWIGARLGAPVPGDDVGDRPIGGNAGLTLETTDGRYVGVGMDIVFHSFPASSEYRAAVDRWLRAWRYQQIDSPDWAFEAVQFTAFVKLRAPVLGRHGPWVKAGTGFYRVDENLADPSWVGSVARWAGRAEPLLVEGWNAGGGLELRAGSNARLALGVQYHEIQRVYRGVPEFTVLTIGLDVMVKW